MLKVLKGLKWVKNWTIIGLFTRQNFEFSFTLISDYFKYVLFGSFLHMSQNVPVHFILFFP